MSGEAESPAAVGDLPAAGTRVDIVVPVFNEAGMLAQRIRVLVEFLSQWCRDDWRIVIADNGSTDGTPALVDELAAGHPRVCSLRIEEQGRGRALKAAWSASDAEVHAYMDADLSTALPALLQLLERVRQGYDIAIGSRHLPGAVLTRGIVRDVLSRAYNMLLRVAFGTSLSDAQRGFKAVTHRVVTDLLRFVESDRWFFDTELLLLAERAGYRIAEVPVRWVEGRNSHVRIVPTIVEYLGEMWRLRRAPGPIAGSAGQPRPVPPRPNRTPRARGPDPAGAPEGTPRGRMQTALPGRRVPAGSNPDGARTSRGMFLGELEQGPAAGPDLPQLGSPAAAEGEAPPSLRVIVGHQIPLQRSLPPPGERWQRPDLEPGLLGQARGRPEEAGAVERVDRTVLRPRAELARQRRKRTIDFLHVAKPAVALRVQRGRALIVEVQLADEIAALHDGAVPEHDPRSAVARHPQAEDVVSVSDRPDSLNAHGLSLDPLEDTAHGSASRPPLAGAADRGRQPHALGEWTRSFRAHLRARRRPGPSVTPDSVWPRPCPAELRALRSGASVYPEFVSSCRRSPSCGSAGPSSGVPPAGVRRRSSVADEPLDGVCSSHATSRAFVRP